jgi:hypothetical protein
MGPNGMFGQFWDVFVILMTKKCTETNILGTFSVKNLGGPPTLLSPSLSPPPKLTYARYNKIHPRVNQLYA